jgi:CBS-domain-containing membrane protein
MFPLSLAYKVFRDQGLRQLFVVDENNELVGMLSRDKLLLHEEHDHMIKNTSKQHQKERMIQRKASILSQSSGNLPVRPTTPKRDHVVEISVGSPNSNK